MRLDGPYLGTAKRSYGCPVGRPAGRPAGQPYSQPAGQPASRPAIQPAGHLAGRLASWLAGRPASHPASRPAGGAASQPAGRWPTCATARIRTNGQSRMGNLTFFSRVFCCFSQCLHVFTFSICLFSLFFKFRPAGWLTTFHGLRPIAWHKASNNRK